MKGSAAAVMAFEAIVVLLGGLLAVSGGDLPTAAVWTVAGVLVVLCVLTAGLLRRGQVGWVLGFVVQALVLVTAFWEPAMVAMGVVFGGLWVMAYVLDRRLAERAGTPGDA